MAFDEETYIKGYNEGYLLAKHAPELSSKLEHIKGQASRLEGLLAGIEQYSLEQSKEWWPSWKKEPDEREQEDERDFEPEP